MDKEEVKEKVKTGLDSFVEKSKKLFGKAGNAVQKFSDDSVTRIEIKQFESKKKAEIKKLGQMALERFLADSNSTLSAGEDAVKTILENVKSFDAEIESRKSQLSEKEKETLKKEESEEE